MGQLLDARHDQSQLLLMFQRPQVLRYLMVHELSHTVQTESLTPLWQIVAGIAPTIGGSIASC